MGYRDAVLRKGVQKLRILSKQWSDGVQAQSEPAILWLELPGISLLMLSVLLMFTVNKICMQLLLGF